MQIVKGRGVRPTRFVHLNYVEIVYDALAVYGRMYSSGVNRKKLDNGSVSFRQSLATRTRAEFVQHTESLPGYERKLTPLQFIKSSL